MTRITINPDSWHILCRHLLPQPARKEEAAFLFGHYAADQCNIRIIDYKLLSREDFVAQEIDYLELDDTVRFKLVKRAHDLHSCLIEAHSHPGKLPAVFSIADFNGLRETAPHMLWRLRGQPYVALVVADNTFDALVWTADPLHPTSLAAIDAGNRVITPTNLSLRRWK
jgi:hypothetical protein